MGKYRKILVAFDGSESSKNALRQAINFAKTEQCWIKALAVVPFYEGELELVGISNIREVLKGPAEKLISEATNIASEEKATVITNLEQGEPYGQIVDVADSENCDLIVMGRRGIHRIERALVGSVTARVIGNTRSDVLVVPKGASLKQNRILLCTDGSKFSLAAAESAIDFAKSYGSEISAVSVVNTNEEFFAQAPELVDKLIENAKVILENFTESAKRKGASVTSTSVREGDPYFKIVELADELDSDIIIMGSHGRTGIKRLLMGSVTEQVIGFSDIPVLVVKP